MEELWDEYFTEMEKAKFSLIAAQLLVDEITEDMSMDDLLDYRRRHRKHIRAVYQHLRKAAKLRKTIGRLEKKASKSNG